MLIRKLVLLLLCLAAARADDVKPVFPGADWEHVASPEAAGFSSAKLDVLRAWMKTQSTTAMMVSVGGRVLFEYGDLKQVSVLASARKSVLGMLYGKYLGNGPIMGTITLDRTLVTPVNELFPSAFRNEAERNDWRLGFGVMWWVWDLPRLPSPITGGSFYGAYSAWGLGGQFITVLPAYNMVVARKVDLKNVREEKYVTAQEFRTILDMLFSSYCGKNSRSLPISADRCRSPLARSWRWTSARLDCVGAGETMRAIRERKRSARTSEFRAGARRARARAAAHGQGHARERFRDVRRAREARGDRVASATAGKSSSATPECSERPRRHGAVARIAPVVS